MNSATGVKRKRQERAGMSREGRGAWGGWNVGGEGGISGGEVHWARQGPYLPAMLS